MSELFLATKRSGHRCHNMDGPLAHSQTIKIIAHGEFVKLLVFSSVHSFTKTIIIAVSTTVG